MAVNIRFLADFTNYLANMSKGQDSTEKFNDSVEETARSFINGSRAAGRSTDEIANAMSKAFGVPFDRAKRAVQQVEDQAADTKRELEHMYEAADDGAKHIESSSDQAARGTSKLKDAAKDVGGGFDELGSIVRDVMSGDVSGAAESAFGALATLGASLGVGGAIGGAIASSLGGLVGSLVEQWDLFGQKSREAQKEVSDALLEMGGAFDEAALRKRILDVGQDTEKWAQANIIAAQTGLDVAYVARALAGDTEALQTASEKFSEAYAQAWSDNLVTQGMRNAKQSLDDMSKGMEDGTSKAAILQRAFDGAAQSTRDAASASASFRDEISQMNARLAELPKNITVSMHLDTSDFDRKLNDAQRRAAAGASLGTAFKGKTWD